MVSKVRLNFGGLVLRLVLFWSGIWYGRLIFLKIFLMKISSTSKMSFRYTQVFFKDPIRVPRIRENWDPRIREIWLHNTGYITFSLK